MLIQRRSFLIGIASALAAPAIVRAGSLMPVKALRPAVIAVTTSGWTAGATHHTYQIYRVLNKLTGEADVYASAEPDAIPPAGFDIIVRIGTIQRDTAAT